MMDQSNKEFPKKGWLRTEPWPVAIVLFFLVIFAVNAVFIRLSMHSWTGLVTEGSYVKGLAYNEVLKAQQAQDALGWRGQLDTSGLRTGGEGRLSFSVWDRNGQPLSDAHIQGVLFRPVQQGMDVEFVMTSEKPGLYSTRLVVPLPGQWDVKLHVAVGELEYRYAQRIHLQAIDQGG